MPQTLTLTLDDDLHGWLVASAVTMDKFTRDMSQPLPHKSITPERFAAMCIDQIRTIHADNMEQAKK